MKAHCLISILLAVTSTSCSTSLQHYTPAVPSAYYLHDGVKIHFKQAGTGRPVIFLHGFGTSLDTWRFVAEALENEYRLVLLDLKGHGFSDRPHDEQYSVQSHARVIMGLIRHLELERVVLVGHSYGSVVALAVALETRNHMQELVSGLALISGSVDVDNLPFVLRLLRTPLIGWLTLKLTSASFRTRLMLKHAYYDDSKVTDSLVELYAKYQSIPGTNYALIKTAEQLIPVDTSHIKRELAQLKIPVMNVWGQHDRIIPRAGAESVCQWVPRCELITMEAVGHLPQEESPEKVIGLLRDFLRRN